MTETEPSDIAVGQVFGFRGDDDGICLIKRPTNDKYILVVTWPTRERFDSDYGSWMCGCPLAGRSHAHVEQTFSTWPKALATYRRALASWDARMPYVPERE